MDKFFNDRVHPRTGEVLFSVDDHAEKMAERGMTADGKEVPDHRPFKPYVNVERRPSMFDYMRAAVRAEIERREQAEYDESSDEMSDMDVDDELVEELSEHEETDLKLTLAKAQKELDAKEAAERDRLSTKKKSSAPKEPAPPARPLDGQELPSVEAPGEFVDPKPKA